MPKRSRRSMYLIFHLGGELEKRETVEQNGKRFAPVATSPRPETNRFVTDEGESVTYHGRHSKTAIYATTSWASGLSAAEGGAESGFRFSSTGADGLVAEASLSTAFRCAAAAGTARRFLLTLFFC